MSNEIFQHETIYLTVCGSRAHRLGWVYRRDVKGNHSNVSTPSMSKQSYYAVLKSSSSPPA